MRLPVMVKAKGGTSYIQPGSLPQCWLEGCYQPNDDHPTGLCADHIVELRTESATGDLQELVA